METLKRLREAVSRKGNELWPSKWALQRDNAAAHKALCKAISVWKKYYWNVVSTIILFPWYGSEWLLFSKIACLKGTSIWGHWRRYPKKNVTMTLKCLPQQEFQKCFQQWLIIGLSA